MKLAGEVFLMELEQGSGHLGTLDAPGREGEKGGDAGSSPCPTPWRRCSHRRWRRKGLELDSLLEFFFVRFLFSFPISSHLVLGQSGFIRVLEQPEITKKITTVCLPAKKK